MSFNLSYCLGKQDQCDPRGQWPFPVNVDKTANSAEFSSKCLLEIIPADLCWHAVLCIIACFNSSKYVSFIYIVIDSVPLDLHMISKCVKFFHYLMLSYTRHWLLKAVFSYTGRQELLHCLMTYRNCCWYFVYVYMLICCRLVLISYWYEQIKINYLFILFLFLQKAVRHEQ